jgi:hypothetical protein
MNVVVAGLSPRDAAAFGFFMSRSMKGWSWESTPAGRGTVLPKADLLVADLVSLGLAHWSEAAEAELLRVLQGSTAVLLVPSHDRTWASMDAGTVKQHALVWLAKPYGSEDMRKALEAAAAVHRAAPPVPAPAAAHGAAAAGPAGPSAPAMAAEVPPRDPTPGVQATALAAGFRASVRRCAARCWRCGRRGSGPFRSPASGAARGLARNRAPRVPAQALGHADHGASF